jgi:hypothetical protein
MHASGPAVMLSRTHMHDMSDNVVHPLNLCHASLIPSTLSITVDKDKASSPI